MARWLACIVGLILAAGCSDDANEVSVPDSTTTQTKVDIEGFRPEINKFCGGCHAVPDPSTFPRNAWFKEVERGYEFYYKSKRTDLKAPPQSKVVAWYRAQAEERLVLPLPETASSNTQVSFQRKKLHAIKSVGFPAISHVFSAAESKNGDPGETLFLDMFHGEVRRVGFTDGQLSSEALIPSKQITNPAHIEKTDLNADGLPDYVLAELGSFQPKDHAAGKVLWFDPQTNKLETLLSGVGRVADVRPLDVDADGDLDLIVAVFGWLETGSIQLLRQVDPVDGVIQFKAEPLDDRHGTIHVPVADLNNDGHPDFVALVSQEFESIDAFINDGKGVFTKQVIFDAKDPSYGSSGIQFADLDGDKDLDILYTNGDMLDGNYLKPYHKIQWLENQGDLKFKHHVIDTMPGVYRAVVGDLDNDGDLDIVAGAHISTDLKQTFADDYRFDSLVWFEQTEPMKFARHQVAQVKKLGYYAININDLDGDGDLDIIAGNHASQKSDQPVWVDVFVNQLK
jgi:hypothetical protein